VEDAAVQEHVRSELPDPAALDHIAGAQPEQLEERIEHQRHEERDDVRDDDPLDRQRDGSRPECVTQ
jgi:hypothetical protein